MLNILIFGTGNGCEKLLETLNYKNVKILAFIDSNQFKHNTIFCNKYIIGAYEINKYNYDFIIIASQFYDEILCVLEKEKIEKQKIINFYDLIYYYEQKAYSDLWGKYCFDTLNSKFIELKKKDVDLIITGISYAKFSINESELIKSCLNFALPSQDLYYDYKIAKKIVDENKKIKYFIIGLCYYSFDYDLSLSKYKDRCVNLYKKILNDVHNYIEDDFEKYINKDYNCDIFLKSGLNKIYDAVIKNIRCIDFNVNWSKSISNTICDEKTKKEEAKKLVALDSKKNYYDTREENKNILKSYIEMLISKKIKPIIVIFPTSKYYASEFTENKKDEFYEIIQKFNNKYNIQILDHFYVEEFDDNCFCDVAHLNKFGASKFTKMLNDEIIW